MAPSTIATITKIILLYFNTEMVYLAFRFNIYFLISI